MFSGVFFQKPRYTFVVVNPYTTGIIGRVRATTRSDQKIVYELLSKHPYVTVDRDSGKIRLNSYERLNDQSTRTTMFRIAAYGSCRCTNLRSITWVRIVSVPAFFGDTILRSLRNVDAILVQENRLSQEATAENLHRLVRRISSKVDPIATETSSAQERIESAFSRASFAIKRFFASK